MQKYLCALLITLSGFLNIQAQTLISAESIGSFTAFQLSLIAGFPVNNGIEQFKVLYEMPGIDGNPDTVSGAVVVPTVFNQEDLPLIVYQHPTSTNGPGDVPSSGGFNIGSLESIAYGAFGFLVFATDYLGLGESRGFHPYLHAETEALAGINMMYASLAFLDTQEGVSWDSTNLFIAGYSQGGHASMALHQKIEESFSTEFTVTAAAHMSGPYSISDVMMQRFLDEEPTDNVAYLPYTIMGYQSAYQSVYDSMGQVFRAPYVETLEGFYENPYALTVLDGQLRILLNENTDSTNARDLLQPDFFAGLQEPESPFIVLARENDTYNWAPSAPTRLLYCPLDETVPFQNAILADSVMRMNGAPDVQAVNVNSFANHVDCTLFAILESIDFFEAMMMTVSVQDQVQAAQRLHVFPNPAQTTIQIEGGQGTLDIEIFNASGVPVWKGNAQQKQTIDVSSFAEGMYYLRVHTENKTDIKPFAIIRS